MRDRRDLLILFVTALAAAFAVAIVALGISYHRWIAVERGHLLEAVRLQAKLLQDAPPGVEPAAGTSVPSPDLYRLLGPEGSIAIARTQGDSFVRMDNPLLAPVPAPSTDPVLDQLLRRALAGSAGSMLADAPPAGHMLWAFAPVAGQPVGVVARMPLGGIDAALARAGMLTSLVLLGLATFSAAVFLLVGRALLRRGRTSDNRFRTLFDNLRSGGVLLRRTGDGFVVAHLNRACQQILGDTVAQMRGSSLGDGTSPAWPGTRLLEAVRRLQRSGQPEHLPAVLRGGPGGGPGGGWHEHDLFRLSDDEVVVLVHDVGDRRRAEDALQESHSRWQTMIKAHTQAVVIVDQKHDIRFVNEPAETLFGQTAGELIGSPFAYRLGQDDGTDIEIVRPGPSIAYGEMRAIPVRWSGEDSLLLIIQDVSAYRRAEGDLRKMFQAIEQSPASVMITDVEGRIEYVNPKFAETTGYTYADVVGKTPGFLRSGHTSTEDYATLWQTIGAGQVWRGEFRNRRKNGELFWELASIAPVRDARGRVTHYVAVKEDISERKATEERLRRSQRMETIGQLTGGIAHDFNNLLAIILGNLQLLAESAALDREGRELIADAIWSAERGAQLTHRLLAFARRQRLNPKLTDLNLVVEEMAGLLRRTLGERIAVLENLAPAVGHIMIDRAQLESALLNLVVNARDAMAGSGVLTIATRRAVLPDNLPNASDDLAPGDYLGLSVTDTGTGMPPDVLERIFEPFFTTKKFGEGSGLGLSMVYGFVRQSGGHIAVDSTPGRGTTVSIFLPQAEVADADDVHGARTMDNPSLGHEVILVVEDDRRVRKTATNILRRQGYEVVEAGDASEALRVVDRLPRLDLLFTDVVLSNGIDGSELAHQVVSRRPETRILLTSGYAQQLPAAGSREGEILELLPKPYRRSELTTRVRQLLDRPPR